MQPREPKPARSEFDMKEFRNFISYDLNRRVSEGSFAKRGFITRTIRGQVVDHEGSPIEGAQVAMAEPIGKSGDCFDENFDKTDEQGRFLIEGQQVRSRLVIRRGPGQIWRVNLKPDERDVKVVWPKPATCKVTVDPKLCEPEAAISITTTKYWAGMSVMQYETRLDKNRQATINNMIPGEYFVSTTKKITLGEENDLSVEIACFTIDAGETKDVHCQPIGVQVTGKLEETDKELAADGKMLLHIDRQKNTYHDWGRMVDIVRVDREGEFKTTPLKPGRYVFRFYGTQKEERRGFAKDTQWLTTRVTIKEGGGDVQLSFPQNYENEVVGFVQQTLNWERQFSRSGPQFYGWPHSDDQISRLESHDDRDGVLKELMRILDDPKSPYPWIGVTVKALGKKLETPGIVDALLETLDKPHRTKSRTKILRALQAAKESAEKVIEHVAKFQDSDDWRLRSAMYSALGKLARTSPKAQDKAVPILIEALNDSYETIRVEAATSLGHCKAVPPNAARIEKNTNWR